MENKSNLHPTLTKPEERLFMYRILVQAKGEAWVVDFRAQLSCTRANPPARPEL